VRKNHNCVYAPDFETVARINAKLSQIGNLEADGRPILGLPSRDLLEIVLETAEHAHLIPAHIWTPWFSMFGSRSGYDSVQECFRDLAGHIFALETGLSSDPEMNWRLSMLDKYTLVSNSDAHSPQKLGREANLFDTERSYYALFDALKTRKGFLGTYEFFPEEGKYHLDGHRKCEVCFEPEESLRHKNRCPKCGQPLTIGVLHRVADLSDRQQPQKPEGAADFHYIIPLPEILAEVKNASASGKVVGQAFQQAVSSFGNEFTLLKHAPIEDIGKRSGALMAEAIRRMRTGQVNPQAGYDGEYGVINIFRKGEIASLTGQMHFFGPAEAASPGKRQSKETKTEKQIAPEVRTEGSDPSFLNAAQQAACEATGAVLVTAGPGTGKTKTLIGWIAHCIGQRHARPQEVLAVTFTNKAADEMQERLATLLGDACRGITVGTFHALCLTMLQERYPGIRQVYDDQSREILLGMCFPGMEEKEIKALGLRLKNHFEQNGQADEAFSSTAAAYQELAMQQGGIDLSDIIGAVVRLWQAEPSWLSACRGRFQYIAVDELQDINPQQYAFLKLLAEGKNLFAIGDPDQSIYGFRGSDLQLFFRFSKDFQAREIPLQQNYRSPGFVLEAAQQVIRNNALRKITPLIPLRPGGGRIRHFVAADEYKEAAFIAEEIEKLAGGFHNLSSDDPLHREGRHGFADMAVLFRTRAVGRILLAACRQAGIPVRFGDASSLAEAYPFHLITDSIRLYLDAGDLVALDGLLTQGSHMDRKEKQAFMASHPEATRFTAIFGEAGETAFARQGAAGAVRFITEKWLSGEAMDDTGRLRLEAILDIAGTCGADLEQFLHQLQLGPYTDVARLKADAVSLLTFHASKGLEFPVVFIAGAEEGITPMLRKDASIEEERRLFYVALTRAKELLYISHAEQRKHFNEALAKTPSRFLEEIPASLLEDLQKKLPRPEQMRLF
jgi:uncharacterized protein (TIGR00375 family)